MNRTDKPSWVSAQKEIRASYDDQTIRVYQAYCPQIANEALLLGTFGPSFGLGRMTWIKPSFLWMMYRSGWGHKTNQERTLAITLKRAAFDSIVANAVISSFRPEFYSDEQHWRMAMNKTDFIVQWDPERDIHGAPLPYRSIQLGLRRQAVRSYVSDWIVKIDDISDYVQMLYEKMNHGVDIIPLLPPERPYSVC